jgi:hypothetical protein
MIFMPPPSLGKGLGGGAPPSGEPALPTYPAASNLRYWFVAENGAYKDTALTQRAAAGDKVCGWQNNGLAEDAKQAAAANAPILRSGGLNGRDYLECNAGATPTWFDDLLEGNQPSGLTSWNVYSVIVVVDQVPAVAQNHFILGASSVASTSSQKAAVWINNAAFRWFKSQSEILNMPNPGGANILYGRKDSGAANAFARGSHAVAPATFTQSTNAISTANTGMRFLRHGSTPGAWFQGRLYELLWFNSVLSLADATTIINNLKSKYGIT